MKLTRALRAWGQPGFRAELKAELEQWQLSDLPLQQALRSGNRVMDERPTVMINGYDEGEEAIVARVGLIFAGLDAGSCCADDPTPVEPHCEYCEIQLVIDRTDGETRVTLMES